MLKFIFELFTNPLSLPIEPFYEWLILLLVGEIAHELAYWLSPGGKEFGSIIYWTTKCVIFIAMWAVLYGLIRLIVFVKNNWIWVLSVSCGVAVLILSTIVISKYKKRKARPSNIIED